MFGAQEEIVRTLAKERIQGAGCERGLQDWCRFEFRTVRRHG